MPAQPVRIKTSLGADELKFSALEGTEQLGRPFLYELELLSPTEDLALDDVLGQEACVELDLPSGGVRYFHGHVTQLSLTGRRGSHATYSVHLRPWLWFLSRTADCRIFQQKTVPEIVQEVFREHGFSDFTDALSGSYRTWEYCVQYRETDFDFVSRLLEQEGIYYFFVHENGKHTLVLADSYGAHGPFAGYDEIPYFPPSATVRVEHVYDWRFAKSVQPGKYALRAYDFRKPRANLDVTSTATREHAQADYEIFDYPGEYFERGEGETYVRARMQELDAGYEGARGVGNARGVCAGSLFKLAEFPRKDQNREYLVLASRQSLSLGDYESMPDGRGLQYACSFEALDSQTPYRVPRVTPKPAVRGPQTARVVGKSGEEIWTDEYGRVKVQFHWDRYGKEDENSSCWVRVAQVWAGASWGAMHVPRIGQEVIVDFIEGDLDRPIVTGRVYNADNMPPYGLPENKTQSGIKSRSSKGGTPDNFNEIRFEDKKGSEQLYIHAEKDQSIVVENDRTSSVGHDNFESVGHDETIEITNNRRKTVGVDQAETVGGRKTITVGETHTETIGGNKTLHVGANHAETIVSNMTQKIGASKSETVGAAKAETIVAAKALTIGGAYQVSVGAVMNQTIVGLKSEQIGGAYSQRIGRSSSVNVDDDSSETVGKNKSVHAGERMSLTSKDDFSIHGSKNGSITIDEQLTIKCGRAAITLKKNGDILINGAKIHAKGSGDIVMKGRKIHGN